MHFWGEECGYGDGDARPVIMMSTLRWWNWKFIFLKGLDFEYMPLFRDAEANLHFDLCELRGGALARVHRFCEGLGKQLTRDSFMNHRLLFDMGCKYVYSMRYLLYLLVRITCLSRIRFVFDLTLYSVFRFAQL